VYTQLNKPLTCVDGGSNAHSQRRPENLQPAKRNSLISSTNKNLIFVSAFIDTSKPV